jgi:uncharacterized membrane protein
MKFHDYHHRTLLKSITWTIVGFLVSFGVLVYFTRDVEASMIDALVIQVAKFVFFYLHERVWNIYDIGQEVKH